MVVGWYHSHPGFGCWLSGVDINTQQVQVDLLLLRGQDFVLICVARAVWRMDIEFRSAEQPRRVDCRGSDSECEGQGRHRRVPSHQPTADDAGPGTASDDVEHWSLEQTIDSGNGSLVSLAFSVSCQRNVSFRAVVICYDLVGTNPRSQPPLLLHRDRLPQERAGRANADEPTQEHMERWLGAHQV